MANRAYASIWCRDFSEESLLERWGEFLSTMPFSATRPGFSHLIIRPVKVAEAPVFEIDLRGAEQDPAVPIELAREHLHSDSCYETQAFWDLWTYEQTRGVREMHPQPVGLFCYGEDYEERAWVENGHFLIDAGFEHLFTGHAGLLGQRHQAPAAAQHPAEAGFLAAMAGSESRRAYQEKTQENIRKLYGWIWRIEAALPVERYRLWSEGEENFEARMEKSWQSASGAAAILIAGVAWPAQPPKRHNELTLAGLRPGLTKILVPEDKFRGFAHVDTTPHGFRWFGNCDGRMLTVEVDKNHLVQTVTASLLDLPRPDCVYHDHASLLKQLETGRGLKLMDSCRRVVQLYGRPQSRSSSVRGARKLELLFYAFDWAGNNAPQVMEVSCDHENRRVVEIMLAFPSL